MAEHTPGPWSIDQYGTVSGPDGRIITINGVASVCSPGPWQNVAKANARLIAAAPDLLAALVAVLDTSGARGTYHALKYVEAVDAAEAAIARATPNLDDDNG